MPVLHARAHDPGPFDPKNEGFGANVAGLVVIVVLVLGISICLAVRYVRNRNKPAAEDTQSTQPGSHSMSSLSSSSQNEKKDGNPSMNTFSREQLTRSVVLPQGTIQPRPQRQSRQEILDFYRQSGSFPKPFHTTAPSSSSAGSRSSVFSASRSSLALASPSAPSPSAPARSSMLNPNAPRHSFVSAQSSAGSRYSVMSGYSSAPSAAGASLAGHARKVRQLFDPVLPDELVLRLHERVALLQAFDDGWCVVAREAAPAVAGAGTSLFRPADAGAADMGVVPAWVFIKPVKGLRAERPIRSTSLGITVRIDAPGFSSRDECVSWSNF
ncbi:hypothetical protein HDZ31DRAFT_32606 [Schizophyllum fasciatum]